MAEEPLTELHLDVYGTREGPWNPEHGEIEIPDDWAFLPSGDAFVTRTVKAAGRYWVAWRPRGRNRPHRRLEGLWAPAAAIAEAQTAAAETAERRERQREQGARQRARSEDRYRTELAAAILVYLGFDATHMDLAHQIADGAAGHAAIVGSGRVGRTRKLPLEDRAALAARAWIRHRFTDYEDRLNSLYGDDLLLDELDYRGIKHDAHSAVDAFLAEHRPPC
ncbi:DUF2293 domain-containing protein [Georgenia yuyongxinii]|uniref:DUF2293 domain-containing protein n=1 Tax=Georgenia yuyongxinii TaxID=2589797 RepID=A0A552WN91_9MICO|nr:DUF2293 domain-containing protein [Georgenia yuyongxinii]TRW43983.1 DUF2293 domain-containing protein [Georgenia yuyongxinii]